MANVQGCFNTSACGRKRDLIRPERPRPVWPVTAVQSTRSKAMPPSSATRGTRYLASGRWNPAKPRTRSPKRFYSGDPSHEGGHQGTNRRECYARRAKYSGRRMKYKGPVGYAVEHRTTSIPENVSASNVYRSAAYLRGHVVGRGWELPRANAWRRTEDDRYP
jgi:hypothetical protein